jgi:outer membrane lipopolysaccharide assembly protein LptE/RlpB
MKRTLLLFFAVLVLASCHSGWSPEYKQSVKDTIATRLNINQPGSPGTKQQKAELCDCMLKVFEKTYPSQLPSTGIPKDTLRKAFFHCCPWIQKI